MATLSTESTPRERLARLISLMKRTRMFWRSALAIAVLGTAVSLGVALNSKRAWRSETTVLYRDAIQTRASQETEGQRAARLGPKLKDLLYARPQLEQVVREFDLFPEKTRRSMLDGVEEMQLAVGFRARASDSFVVSFTYFDPKLTQEVTARLAELMIEEYNRQNLDTATLTRDFLQRELGEANGRLEEASRALATFLAQNPKFQWGVNDSPYAPVPAPVMAPLPMGPGRLGGVRGGPIDPVLAALERELVRVEAQLSPGSPGAPATAGDAQRQRDHAAAALVAAQGALDEKLQSVTPAHPDAISARAKVEAARQSLAAAESALRGARSGGAAEPGEASALPPAKRAQLEQQRNGIRRQIADRRARLGGGGAPVPRAGTGDAGAPAKSGSSDVVELETEWHRLRLELDRARDQLRLVQANAHAADISADAVQKQSQEEMQILEPAYRPTRPDRGRGRVFLVGVAITFFLALAYAASRVLLNDTLLDEGDVEALGGPAMLVTLPLLSTPPPPPPEREMVPAVRPPSDPDFGMGIRRAGAPMPPPPDPPAPPEPPPMLEPPRPASPALPRAGTTTIRFGATLPVPSALPDLPPEVLAAHEEQPSRAALEVRAASRVASAALAPARAVAAPRDPFPYIEVPLDDPDVEVLGADVDPDGEGAFALLHGAAPWTLAALRVLRHRLDQRRGDESFVVSVVSPGAGEGKTTLAVELAMTLAEAERARVVLVEGNFERPRVAPTLGLRLPESAGFSAQIRRRMHGHNRPWGVIRLGPSLAVLAEPFSTAAYPQAVHSIHFEAALAALRRNYDYVVIDGPSVLGAGDANVIETVSDGVLLIARAAATKGAALSRATQQLGDRRILGVVLNGVSRREETAIRHAA